jgi:phenylacetate-CoA ligase
LSELNDGIRLKSIFAGGELLEERAKKSISKSFCCPVFDRYGSMETSWIAWECEKGSMHIQADQAIVEILDEKNNPQKPGRIGKVVVTPLWQRAMPFIRYSLGDLACIGGRCTCGRGLPVLRSINGRKDDLIILPSGKKRSARAINLMDDIEGILSYQIIQEREDLFVFRYVPAKKDIPETTKRRVSQIIKHGCLGEPVSVEFDCVKSIEKGSSGKIRTVVSKVVLDES